MRHSLPSHLLWTSLTGLLQLLLRRRRGTRTDKKEFGEATRELERILLTNLLPFWRRQVGDEKAFGYDLTDKSAADQADANLRGLVVQARTLWFFSKLMQTPFGIAVDAANAHRGFRFLTEKMWDRQNEGFYWHTDARDRPVRPNKQLYGHAFALFALSEYAVATGSTEASHWAHGAFEILERRFHDPDYPGYREFFAADWSEVPPTERSYLGRLSEYKLYDSHLHVLEALIEYRRVHDTALVRQRMAELCAILSERVVRRPHYACSDLHFRDWRPALPPQQERLWYGVDLENVHLLIAARNALGEDNTKYVEFYRAVFTNARRYGEDRREGGFFFKGPVGKPADDLRKIWWPQAEALVACAEMLRLTGERKYAKCLMRTLDWVVKRQVDWEGGEWFAEITSENKIEGPKVGLLKGPYHTGRAVLQCLEILNELAGKRG